MLHNMINILVMRFITTFASVFVEYLFIFYISVVLYHIVVMAGYQMQNGKPTSRNGGICFTTLNARS